MREGRRVGHQLPLSLPLHGDRFVVCVVVSFSNSFCVMEMKVDSPISFLPLCVLFSLCIDNFIEEMASTIYITTLLSILDHLPLYVCSC
jgi:hypothetical protein